MTDTSSSSSSSSSFTAPARPQRHASDWPGDAVAGRHTWAKSRAPATAQATSTELPRQNPRAWVGGVGHAIDGSDTARLVDASEASSARSEITVLLADDQAAMRAGVRRAIESHSMRVVAEAITAEEAVRAALAHRPDVCIMDVRVPGNGIDAARKISDALPDTKILMLTASQREDDMFASLRAGADGYLLKTTSPARLPLAVLGVLRGEAALPRELGSRLIREFRDGGRSRRLTLSVSGQGVELTARESEVLERLRWFDTTAEIARRLQISEVTVRRHISAILHKLGVRDRNTAVELLERAEQRGAA